MGSVSSSLKSKLLFVWWLKIRCLAFLKVWLNLDRRYIGWDQATCQVQWKEWFRWYLLYKGEVMLYEEEMLRQQLQRQKKLDSFFPKTILFEGPFQSASYSAVLEEVYSRVLEV